MVRFIITTAVILCAITRFMVRFIITTAAILCATQQRTSISFCINILKIVYIDEREETESVH